MLSVFISHSHEDTELVKRLITLIRSSLNLSATEIRATSVDGYRLPGGANVDERLRTEVQDTKVLVGVISTAGARSSYVTFELGARWGSGKPMVPLLAPGVGIDALAGPLKGINALSCDSPAQLHQLVDDISQHLELKLERAAAYQKCIDDIVDLGRRFSRGPSLAANERADRSGNVQVPPTHAASEATSRGPHIGQPKLADAERDAHSKLQSGASGGEVVAGLERRGVPRRLAEEMVKELRRTLDE